MNKQERQHDLKPFSILIVEDSDADFEVTSLALRRAQYNSLVLRCETGDEAMEYLNRRGPYAKGPPMPSPNIILLDLNMPGTDGREVLRLIKGHDCFRKIPVVVITTSDDEKDVRECYKEGANSYIQKPVDIERFMESVALLKRYWTETVLLPKGCGDGKYETQPKIAN